MKYLRSQIYFILFFGVFCGGDLLRAADPQLLRALFERDFRANQGRFVPHRSLPNNSRIYDENIHFVFITGFLSILETSYFQDQMDAIERMGVPSGRLHLIKPSSSNAIDQGAKAIFERLRKMDGKFVLIAHSKGSAEVLELALSHPDFIEEKVDDMFLLQSAVKGSKLATVAEAKNFDWTLLKGLSDADVAMAKRILFVARNAPKRLFPKGFHSLSEDERNKSIDELLVESQKAIPFITDKTHWMVSSIEEQDLMLYPQKDQTLWRVLKRLTGHDSDGMLPVADQKIDEVGAVILTTSAGHSDFTNSSRSVLSADARRALGISILTATETKRNLGHPQCPWAFGNLNRGAPLIIETK